MTGREIDREKVVKELREIQEHFEARANVAGVGRVEMIFLGWANAARDARELLETQEPIRQRTYKIWGAASGMVDSFACGACQYQMDEGDRFCRHCGRPVKWDDGTEF